MSTDSGTTWMQANDVLGIKTVLSIAIDSSSAPSTVFLGTYEGGVYRGTSVAGSTTRMREFDADIRAAVRYNSCSYGNPVSSQGRHEPCDP
ncbi:MAG: hypothetical protein HYX75_09385 [Acidobacteria bacterium]|nr:hypothetical protein [Acidobacteriota bacterium]